MPPPVSEPRSRLVWRCVCTGLFALFALFVAAAWPVYERMRAMREFSDAINMMGLSEYYFLDAVRVEKLQSLWPSVGGYPRVTASAGHRAWNHCADRFFHYLELVEENPWLPFELPRVEFLREALRGNPVLLTVHLDEYSDCPRIAAALRKFPAARMVSVQCSTASVPPPRFAELTAAVADLNKCEVVEMTLPAESFLDEDMLRQCTGIAQLRHLMLVGPIQEEALARVATTFSSLGTLAFCNPPQMGQAPDPVFLLNAVRRARPAEIIPAVHDTSVVTLKLGPVDESQAPPDP